MSSVNVVLKSTVIRHRSASGLSDDGPSESSKFSRDTPPALPSVTFASSVSSPARSDRGGKALRSLDLYDESARHYAWKKQALVDQKHDWRIWLQLILEEPDTSRAATAVAWITATAIVAQVLLIMFESGAFSLMGEEKRYEVADYTLVAFFSVEFVLRTVGATRLAQLCMSFFWWIDLLGVAPFYLELILSASVDTDNVKALSDVRDLLRLLRIVRVLKVMRHHPDSKILARALQMSARPLLVPFTFLVIGAIFFGSFVFFFERLEMRDELELAGEEGQFPDIGTAVWFMLVTFSTVGYGDVSPDSHSGKAVTSLAIIAGLIFMSMPLTIVGTNFSRVWEGRHGQSGRRAAAQPATAGSSCPRLEPLGCSTLSRGEHQPRLATERPRCGREAAPPPSSLLPSTAQEDKEKMTAVVKIQEHLIDRNLSVADVRKIFEEADLDYTGVAAR